MGDYQIRVTGHLDASWSEWFEQMAICHEPDGTTTLVGAVADQSALYGLIRKAGDMGLALLAVCPLTTRCAGEVCARAGEAP